MNTAKSKVSHSYPNVLDSTNPKTTLDKNVIHSTMMQQGYQQLAQYHHNMLGDYMASMCEPTVEV